MVSRSPHIDFIAARMRSLSSTNHVVSRRIEALHGFEHLLLVDVDQHAAIDGIPYSRLLDLPWLKDDIAIRQRNR